jgi:hypothetical protein
MPDLRLVERSPEASHASEIFGVDGLVVLLFPVCFVLALWALIDAAIRPPVRLVGGVLGIVYLTAIRPKLKQAA